jgi:hypothetical protein
MSVLRASKPRGRHDAHWSGSSPDQSHLVSLDIHRPGPIRTQLLATIKRWKHGKGTPMSGGLTRTCAMATAFGALLFFFAITFGLFSPPVRLVGDRPNIAQIK